MKALRKIFLIMLLSVWPVWVLAAAMSSARYEAGGKELLLEVQRALQDFHVDQERYVPRLEMEGTDLINVLLDFGFLEEPPHNPATGESYALDGKELDPLRYSTDELYETYSLRVLDPDLENVLLEIDSVEQQSLE